VAVVLLCVALISAASLFAGKDLVTKQWQSVAKYYMEAANMMPAEHFTFKPTKEIFSYAQQILHVAGANFYFAAMAKGEKSPKPREAFKAEGKSKKEVIALLKESFAYGMKVIESMSGEQLKSRKEFAGKKHSLATILLFCCEHAVHHRGQMIIYLRLKGIKPPKYTSGYLD
jgi:uncharacterized damage-inducible protein DinB